MTAEQVFLTTDNDGKILICDKHGQVFSGQVSVDARNAVDEPDSVTVTMYHGGWVRRKMSDKEAPSPPKSKMLPEGRL